MTAVLTWMFPRSIVSSKERIHNYPGLGEFCQTMYDKQLKSPYLLAFMVDMCEDKLDDGVDKEATLTKAVEVSNNVTKTKHCDPCVCKEIYIHTLSLSITLLLIMTQKLEFSWEVLILLFLCKPDILYTHCLGPTQLYSIRYFCCKV